MGTKTAGRRAAPKKVAGAVAIAQPALKKGERYIGAILGADGKGHHTILLAGEKSGSWQEMMDWAKKAGGDLPNRIEQAMLFANHRALFKREAYWSNTQSEHDAGYAWLQDFYGGGQGCWRKGSSFRAVAVRRVAI